MERTNRPLTNEAAKKLMALDVQDKEILTYEKLDEWYTAWGGQCYVSFSGGKDSTVLAYLAARYLSGFRTPPWELNLVFVNTGLAAEGVSPRDRKPCAASTQDEHSADGDEVRVQHREQRGVGVYRERENKPHRKICTKVAWRVSGQRRGKIAV